MSACGGGGGTTSSQHTTPQSQVITFDAIAPQAVGTTLTLAASANSGLAVSFASTTPAVCTVSGATASFIAAGTCTIQATQAGNNTYAAATPVSQSLTVNGEAQTITFGAIPAQTVGTTFTLAASASSGLPISFVAATPAICTVSGATASFIAAGICTIQANQAGDSTYAAAAPFSQSFTVNGEAQAITFGAIPAQTVGTPLTLSASASSGLAVSFASTTTAVCTVSGVTANFIAAGTCTIQATQAGNNIYVAAAPLSQSFTVNGEAQTITFGTIPAQSVGTSLTLSASASSGLAVSFASTTSDVCTVSGVTASFIAAGTCTIQATQAGNSTYAAAPPVLQSFTDNGKTQTVSFGAIATQTVGTPLTLSASASSGLAVSFASTTSAVCTVSGATASFIAAGTCTVQAIQAGNSTYTAAAPVSQSFIVNGAAQTINFGAIPAQTVGTPLALSASASSGLAVSFASTTPNVCTVSGVTANFIVAGTCTIQAAQAGNGTYLAAAPVSRSFTVNGEAQTITFAAIPAQTVGTPLTLSASASSGLAVSFASTTSAVCTVSGVTANFIVAGTCTVQAIQAGNSTYTAAAPMSQSFTVNGEAQTITFGTIPAQTVGTLLTLSASASSGLTVSFASTTTAVCTVSGVTANFIAAGTCTIQATQAGNNTYAAAAPVLQSFTVNGEAQNITFSAIPAQKVGTPLTLSASASSGLAVTFASTTPAICSVSGVTANFIIAGTCTIQAAQAGNGTYLAAAPVSRSFTVNGEAQTITFAAIPAQKMGTPLTLSASASSGLAVSFASTTSAVCTVSGVTASFIAGGTCTIQATQAGNSTYAAATPVSQSFTDNGKAQTVTFGAIATQAVGTPLTLSASASSGLAVSFASTTSAVCTVSGVTASFIAGGTCTIQATQAGNSTYTATTPVSQSFTVKNLAPTIGNFYPHFVIAGSAAQNLTLSGKNFIPGTSATFAGSSHSITYVNSTLIVLPLSAADLATAGVQAITLNNPAPGGGTVSVNFPVLFETDAMLARSQMAAGDQARLQLLIEKGRNGTPVTIAAIGGSITAGGGASDPAHLYGRLVQDWWNKTFPTSISTYVNAGLGGTGSDYGSLRLQRDVLSYNPDLVIVEFAVNDTSASHFEDTYEGLVRQLLDAPSHPVVILLFMMDYRLPIGTGSSAGQPWQSAIGANYNVPMVSYYDAISPELLNGNISIAEITPDGIHPNDLGNAYAAQFLDENLQIAINNFPADTALEPIPVTQAPKYSSDFEFTSLDEGNGNWGPPLNPTSNQGWATVSNTDAPYTFFPSDGLESSTPGSTLDFTVTGKDLLLGYLQNNGPAGQISLTVDGGATETIDSFNTSTTAYHVLSRIANGLTDGPHQVHIELLSTKNSASTGNRFILLCVGAGGVE